MIQKFSLSDAAEIHEWDSFVETQDEGTPYHLTAWIKTIRDTYNYEPVLYAIKNEKGKIECVFPLFLIKGLFTNRRIISIPFSDYGGALTNNAELSTAIIEKARKDYPAFAGNIEIRSILPFKSGFEQLNYYKRHLLRLDGNEKSIQSKLNKRTIQYSIRKAEKQGVKVNEDNSETGLEHFIRLNRMTRKKHGVPSQPDKFFQNLFKNVISKNHGFILLAEYDTKIIAGSMFIKSGKQIHYKYNASDPVYLKTASPNHLITWEAIKKGISEGYESLDFGRTATDNVGLIRYKQMWSALEIDCNYSFYPNIHGASSKTENSRFYKFATMVWKIFPEFMRTMIGSYIYRYLC